MRISKQDKELIEMAKQVAIDNADLLSKNSGVVVGCVVRAKSGKIYKGVNLKSSHSVCAEQIAIGQAFACGERDLTTIVATRLDGHDARVVSPCGLCRYVFDKFNLDFDIILEDSAKRRITKAKVDELLPYPYVRELPAKIKKLK